jgi:hypothetical protein
MKQLQRVDKTNHLERSNRVDRLNLRMLTLKLLLLLLLVLEPPSPHRLYQTK